MLNEILMFLSFGPFLAIFVDLSLSVIHDRIHCRSNWTELNVCLKYFPVIFSGFDNFPVIFSGFKVLMALTICQIISVISSFLLARVVPLLSDCCVSVSTVFKGFSFFKKLIPFCGSIF